MGNGAADYLTEIVDPTLAEFERNPASRRHAFLASVAIFHTIDYMYGHASKNQRKALRDKSPPFGLVDRVAHAFKHVHSGNANDHTNQPLDAVAVIHRPRAAIGQFAIGLSRIGDEDGGVTLVSDVDVDLLIQFREAVKFLRTQF